MRSNNDEKYMCEAIDAAQRVRCITSPNPWVGCVVVSSDGQVFEGATHAYGGAHAEQIALDAAGAHAQGATAYVTLEPCAHVGHTPACAQELINAGVNRVVIGMSDPDQKVSGRGIELLQNAGVAIDIGVCQEKIEKILEPYIVQRKTGRPYVVAKLGMTIDGFIADETGTSQWITGTHARQDAHKLRAESDAILVGANTARLDNPSLRVHDYVPDNVEMDQSIDPLRFVLGEISHEAAMQPCEQLKGDIDDILDDLGSRGIIQLLVEGGGNTIAQFHEGGLIDRYIFYVAPAIFSGSSALHTLGKGSSALLADIWRGKFDEVMQLGSDIRIDIVREGS